MRIFIDIMGIFPPTAWPIISLIYLLPSRSLPEHILAYSNNIAYLLVKSFFYSTETSNIPLIKLDCFVINLLNRCFGENN